MINNYRRKDGLYLHFPNSEKHKLNGHINGQFDNYFCFVFQVSPSMVGQLLHIECRDTKLENTIFSRIIRRSS